MKAIVYTKYGTPDVLQLKDVEKPVINQDEVLIKIKASTVTAVDSIFRQGKNFFARMGAGVTKPKNKILGTEFSGIIEKIGESVTKFQVGDEVFGPSGDNFACHAEYISLPQSAPILRKPGNLSFEESSAVPSGTLTALPFLRDNGKIKNGDNILIIGASGSVGSYAVQLAKHFGAEVTGVCSSANVELVKSLGADYVIDYKVEDFTKNDQKYDIIFDTIGKSSFSKSKNSLKSNGIFLTTFVSFSILFNMLLTSKLSNKKAIIAFTGLRKGSEKLDDIVFIRELIESGKLKPVIDKVYPMEKIAEAHHYVDSGHKKGNVVVKF